MNTIVEVNCVKCGEMNLVELGDMEDLSVQDVDAFRCWNCKEVSWVQEGNESLKILTNHKDPKNANILDIDFYGEDDCDIRVEDGKRIVNNDKILVDALKQIVNEFNLMNQNGKDHRTIMGSIAKKALEDYNK